MTAIEYVKKYFGDAFKAYSKYGIHPLAILAQGALESAYGESTNAKSANNLYGITAAGSTNEYWNGASRTASTGLKFRVYNSTLDSTMDFARLIAQKYPNTAKLSTNIAAYAKSIAQSPYISESNGDNRATYESGIVARANLMQATVTQLLSEKKK
ncbi:MAG: glucosaminidase domain-containing protein [Prevotellaceae bacterium]|jgi:flagellar protein FlgJ|nr:glucosaminidase domain-containing protein [Prevotellaceae bacterium]